MGNMMEQRAGFKSMKESTRADWDIIVARHQPFASELSNRIMEHLTLLGGIQAASPSIACVIPCSRPRSRPNAGKTRNMSCARCCTTSAIPWARGIIQTCLRPSSNRSYPKPTIGMVEKHGIFQGYYFFEHIGMDANMREQFRECPYFERTARFCEMYDNPTFDPDMECAPLAFFEPMLRRVFAFPKNSIYRDTCHAEGK